MLQATQEPQTWHVVIKLEFDGKFRTHSENNCALCLEDLLRESSAVSRSRWYDFAPMQSMSKDLDSTPVFHAQRNSERIHASEPARHFEVWRVNVRFSQDVQVNFMKFLQSKRRVW